MTALATGLIEELNLDIRGWAHGINVEFRCLSPEAHQNGDARRSASINTETGAWNCKACEAKGGAYDLVLLSGRSPADAMALLKRLGMVEDNKNDEWDRVPQQTFKAKLVPAPIPAPGDEPVFVAQQPEVSFDAAIEMSQPLLARLFAVKGWTEPTLTNLGVTWDERRRRLALPVRNEKGQHLGYARYRPGADPTQVSKMLADKDVPRMPFPPPESLIGDEVWPCEGEPDAISLNEIGLNGVGIPGAESWRPEWATRFRRFERAYVIGDCDDAGRRFARKVAADIAATGVEVRIIDLDPSRDDKHDVGDEIAALAVEDRAGYVQMLRDRASMIEPLDKDAVEIERAALRAESVGLPLVVKDGADVLAHTQDVIPAVWGSHPDVLWAKCEPLVLGAPTGTGKTTIANQIVLRRIGVIEGEFFGAHVVPSDRPVLYLSLDRDKQAQRSLRRMVETVPRGRLLWHSDFGNYRPTRNPPKQLVEWIWMQRAETVIIDSLYGLIPSAKDEKAIEWYTIFLRGLAAAEIDVMVLHHFRKKGSEESGGSLIDRLHGGQEIAASAGSVIVLDGEPGDREVEAYHVKQPGSVCGPWTLSHDHAKGITTTKKHMAPLEYIQAHGGSSWKEIADGCHMTYRRSIPPRLDKILRDLISGGEIVCKDDTYRPGASLPSDVPW